MKKKMLLKKITVFAIVLFCLVGASVYGQDVKIKGTVISASDGIPISGASIMVQNSKIGVTTDENGNYSIEVPKTNTTLVFSYTGRVSITINAKNNAVINVKMEVAKGQLAEVVVTALGIKRASKDLGYSVQTLSGEQVSTAKELNVANSLQGQVAGVYVNQSSGGPAGSTYIDIRGASSIGGNNLPLFVVDGVPIDNQQLGIQTYDAGTGNFGLKGGPQLYGAMRDFGDGIGNINPDDIASMSVLKGPAAAALYGARGAHGVVLITTKKGQAGKARVDFSSGATFETINVLPKVQNSYGGGYGDDNSNFSPYVVNGQQQFENGDSVWVYGSQLDDWGGKYDGRPMVFQAWPGMKPIRYSPQGSSPWKEFFRTGSTFTNSVAVSGGTEKATYRLSLTDLENKGITPNNSMNRQSIDLITTLHPTSKLTVEAKFNYVRQHSLNPPETAGSNTNVNASMARMATFVPLSLLKDYINPNGLQNNFVSFGINNPYWLMNKVTADGSRDRIMGYALARYQFNDWLNLQVRSGTDFYYDVRKQVHAVGTNDYNGKRGQVDLMNFNVKEDNSDVLLSASGKLSGNFKGSLTLGANHRDSKSNMLTVVGSQLIIPNLYTTANSKLVTSFQSPTQKIMNSAYFSGQVGYKDYLFLDVTGRNDWSSTLGMNNYSFFYPSVSGSFVFSDALKINSSIFKFGKLRASYAEAGNDASAYMTQGGYYLTNRSFGGNLQASINSDVPLANLKNELSKSYEIGTELRFFNDRLSLDFTYYTAKTLNQITPIQVSNATGYGTRLINAGEIDNKGIEIFASVTPIKSKDFKWDVTFNFSRNKSKVASLAPGLDTYLLLETYNGATIQAVPGQPFGNIMGIPFATVPKTSSSYPGARLLNAQGVWQSSDQQEVLGNIQPDWLGGVTNTFTYKSFTLGALLDIRQGGQVFSLTKYNQMASGTGAFTENRTNLIADGVIQQPDGSYKKSDIVLLAQEYYAQQGPWSNIAQPMIINASFVALRQVTIGYNIGHNSLLKKTPFKTAKFSIVARNLLYLKIDPQFKQMGLSPENAFNTSFAAQGVETPGLPTTRSVGFNLSFSF